RGRLLCHRPAAGPLSVCGGFDPCRARPGGKQALVSIVPSEPVLDSKFPFHYLEDLPLPGWPAHSRRIDDDHIALLRHWTSLLSVQDSAWLFSPPCLPVPLSFRCARSPWSSIVLDVDTRAAPCGQFAAPPWPLAASPSPRHVVPSRTSQPSKRCYPETRSGGSR